MSFKDITPSKHDALDEINWMNLQNVWRWYWLKGVNNPPSNYIYVTVNKSDDSRFKTYKELKASGAVDGEHFFIDEEHEVILKAALININLKAELLAIARRFEVTFYSI